MDKGILYTARWYAAKIRDTNNLEEAKFLAMELIDVLSEALGEKPIGRESEVGDPVKEIPPEIDIPVGPTTIPKSMHIFPRSTRVELDPDRNGIMPAGKPKGVVLHYTLSYNLGGTVDYFKKNFVDVHFVVGHDGTVVQMVEGNRAAAHAGQSSWKGLTSLNDKFIGIEIVSIGPLVHDGKGHLDDYNLQKKRKGQSFKYWTGPVRAKQVNGYTYWEPFTEAQENSAFAICRWAMQTYGITPDFVAGHDEVSPGRKFDPGGCLSMGMDKFRELLKG